MKNFLFFKAFYENKAHYLCDFYESIAGNGSAGYEIIVEARGKQMVCTASKSVEGVWEIRDGDGLDDAVGSKLLHIISGHNN